jgi:uncharacterized Zn finger protein
VTPRRVRGGIKLRRQVPEPTGPIARRWLALTEAVVPAETCVAGLEYARRGQTVSLEIASGRIEARVQGSRSTPYQIRWRVPVFGEEAWRDLVDAMASEALYAAKLLAGELPPAFEERFTERGLELVPGADEVTVECDCPVSGPCKHVAAVGYLVVEQLDEDPLAVLKLRGGPDLLERLAEARAVRSHGQAAAHAEPVVGDGPEASPLEADLAHFWRPGSELTQLREMPPSQHAPLALLRRLGPSPLEGRFPLMGLLASIYDTVSRSAVRLRDRAEGIGD